MEINTFELLNSNYSNWFHSDYGVLLAMKRFQFKIQRQCYFTEKTRLFITSDHERLQVFRNPNLAQQS